jgi:hypothetical protein
MCLNQSLRERFLKIALVNRSRNDMLPTTSPNVVGLLMPVVTVVGLVDVVLVVGRTAP